MIRTLAAFSILYLLGAAATALAAVAVMNHLGGSLADWRPIYVGTGQLAAFLFVGVVI